jgi:hypothetical protein
MMNAIWILHYIRIDNTDEHFGPFSSAENAKAWAACLRIPNGTFRVIKLYGPFWSWTRSRPRHRSEKENEQ